MKRIVFGVLLSLMVFSLHAQRDIKGSVADSDGEPLIGATIQVAGHSSVGTTTDFDGNFELRLPEDAHEIIVSYVGFESQNVIIGEGDDEIQVVLYSGDLVLDEVVVVGYGTQRRREVTSAITKVGTEKFNQGGVRSPLDLIQGKVAGLTITRPEGNNPNSGTAIQLRGVTSLTGSISPLIVIDGVPGGSLDMLQQDDIESFDVLKDGSAAAIYGTRANGGVILITTKKGRAGDPHFEYSTYFQREMVDRKPNYLSTEQFRDLISQGIISSDQDYGSSSDLYDELINKNNISQYHYLSASGGGLSTNYRASVYYNDAQGIAKENGRQEFGGRLNVNQRGLQDRLMLQVNLASNFNDANLLGGKTGDFEQAVQRNPTAPIIEDGEFVETQAYNNYNPMSRLANRLESRNQQTFIGDARLTLDLTDDLSVSAFGSYQRNNWNDRLYRSMNDWDQRPSTQYQGMGYASKYNRLDWSKTFETTIDYNVDISRDHTFGAIAGYSYQYATLEEFSVNNNGFTTDAFKDWNIGAGSAINNDQLPRPGMGSFKEDNTLIAFFGRVNYTFRQKYFAQAVLRHEGSSRFGTNHKWGNFPAVSVGWDISEEDFFQSVSFVDNLKIRAGYGVTGNQGIGNYQSLVTLGTGGVYPQEGVFYQTYGAARNPNPDLKWEKKQEMNVGVDFGLLENRLSGSVDVYNRKTVDLLYQYTAQQPPFVQSSIYTNVGSISNHGVELQLNFSAVDREDFTWNIDFAGNSQFNKLTSLSDETFKANYLEFYGLPSPGNLGAAIRLEEGGAVGNFYGKRFAGFNEEGKWLFYKEDGSTGTAGEMAPEDLTIIGNGVPNYMASLNNYVRYKNFDLTLFFRGKFAFDILNTQDLYFGNKKWLPNNLLESAITKNDELNDDPQYSDYYLEKGDFVKLDNITLGYNFNFSTPYIRSMKVYITGRNLATITGYSGLDPELQDTGFETGVDGRGFYPRTKSLSFGLNIGF